MSEGAVWDYREQHEDSGQWWKRQNWGVVDEKMCNFERLKERFGCGAGRNVECHA